MASFQIALRQACTQARLLRPCASATGGMRLPQACFSTDTHDDFKPQSTSDAPQNVMDAIKDDVTNNKVMLYMKGYPDQPMCGFSARVVALLRGYGIAFESRNVLDDNELREGIKKYSNWPTIPQVYCDGEFLGGCDVLWEAHEAGDFPSLFHAGTVKENDGANF